MVDCRYCDANFEDEEALLSHLAADHDPSQLSPIDRRRVTTADGDEGGLPTGAIAGIGIGAVIVLGMLAAVVLLAGDGGGGGDPPVYTDDVAVTPTDYASIHEHGLMSVEIEGEAFDFAGDSSLIEADPYWFHFHGGNNVWHTHGQDVTLEYALATLGIEVDEGGAVLRYDGQEYDDRDGDTTVVITVNGDPIDPTEYVLDGVLGASPEAAADGDHVEVVVEREG